MSKAPIYNNKDGSLTAYALKCGYLEEVTKDCIHIYMFWDSCTYAIKAYDKGVHLAWYTNTSLPEARKIYKQLIRDYHAK